MSTISIWTVILGMGLGTFLLRFSFLGILGARPLPEWLLRHLRYTPVAVIPGLMAGQVFAPTQSGWPDPWVLAMAAVVMAVGTWSRSSIWAIVAGMVMLVAMVAAGAT